MRFYIFHIWVRLNTFGIYVIKYIASINSFFQVVDAVYRNALYFVHMSVSTIKLIHYSSLLARSSHSLILVPSSS